MNFLSLDLEFDQPSGQIIQIGAVVGNIATGDILGRFSAYVKIEVPLNPFIVQLTGITDAELAHSGTDLITAYKKLLAFRAQFQDVQVNPLTWGGGDSQELLQQLQQAHTEPFEWPLGRRWFDVKTLFQFRQMRRHQKPQAGLAKALTKLGMQFKGRKHNALDDALNTLLAAHQLYKEGI